MVNMSVSFPVKLTVLEIIRDVLVTICRMHSHTKSKSGYKLIFVQKKKTSPAPLNTQESQEIE